VEDKIDESITTINRNHYQKHDKIVQLLKVYGQQLEESKINNEIGFEKIDLRLEKLQELLGDLTCHQSPKK
jgi:hypothetical protein